MGNLLCCVQVEQSTVAVKEGFGRFEQVLQPGCHCMPWFLGKQVAGHLSLRLQQLDLRCETKTKVLFLPNTLTITNILRHFLVFNHHKYFHFGMEIFY